MLLGVGVGAGVGADIGKLTVVAVSVGGFVIHCSGGHGRGEYLDVDYWGGGDDASRRARLVCAQVWRTLSD